MASLGHKELKNRTRQIQIRIAQSNAENKQTKNKFQRVRCILNHIISDMQMVNLFV